MRDPHVQRLHYRVRTDTGLSFNDPDPLDDDTHFFTMRLSDDMVLFEMKKHCSTEEDAKRLVEPYLEAWEIYTGVQSGRKEFWFEFDHADIIDRDPLPTNTAIMTASGSLNIEDSVNVGLRESVTLHRTCKEYPKPPSMFSTSPDVKSLWVRYQGYVGERELLISMAYWCLSVLETSASGKDRRKAAARKYRIDLPVLAKLGELTANVGDDLTARKKHTGSQNRPPTAAEIAWIESAVRALIRRCGEYSFDAAHQWPVLTMSDLPPL